MLATIAASLTDYDLYLLGEGNHYRCYEKPGGAHVGEPTAWPAHFAVWASNAKQVLVIGDFNGWLASIIRIVSNWRKQGRLDADEPMRGSAKFAILKKWTYRADNPRVSAAGARHALPEVPDPAWMATP
jgi:hypothetical protein